MKSYLEIISDFQENLIRYNKNLGDGDIKEMKVSNQLYWGIMTEMQGDMTRLQNPRTYYRSLEELRTSKEFCVWTPMGAIVFKRDTEKEKQELRRQIEKLEDKIKELG
jgi:hypothetical protein